MAHSIKEIILGMKNEPVQIVSGKGQSEKSVNKVKAGEIKEGKEKPAKTGRVKFLIPIAIVALLILMGIIAYPKIFKRNTIEKLRAAGERICVAVMPFQNLTSDTVNWNHYQYIVQTSLTTHFSNYPEYLQVRQTESINEILKSNGIANYASFTPSFAGKISQKLAADVFVYGNIIKSGNVIRLVAKLIDTKTEEIIKSFQIEGPSGEVNFLPEIDSLSGMVKDFLIIAELKKEWARNKPAMNSLMLQQTLLKPINITSTG